MIVFSLFMFIILIACGVGIKKMLDKYAAKKREEDRKREELILEAFKEDEKRRKSVACIS